MAKVLHGALAKGRLSGGGVAEEVADHALQVGQGVADFGLGAGGGLALEVLPKPAARQTAWP